MSFDMWGLVRSCKNRPAPFPGRML